MRRALSLARRAVMYEIGMWRSLLRWILRRPHGVTRGAEAFGYASVVTPILAAFIGVSAIEVPVVHLLLPWETVRLVALALGAYGLFWMVGLLASLRMHPHVVNDAGLRLRNGVTADITIPWDAIGSVDARYRSLSAGRNVRIESTASGTVLHLGVAHQTSVDLVLREPASIRLPKGPTPPVTELRFYVDDPKGLVARVRERLAAVTGP